MSVPDDSALCHAGVYDPAKARAYYLRTRNLKGRKAGGQDVTGQPQAEAVKTTKGSSRQQEIKAQKVALTKRLDKLRSILAELVDKAKSRSGVEDKPDKNDPPSETAARNESNKKNTPLTASQKRQKTDKAREEYKKQGGPSASKELEQLQRQIKDIRAKIDQAIKDARRKTDQSKNQTASKGR